MAAIVFRSWFDDSERDDRVHNVAAVAGCVGTEDQWNKFDAAWTANVLDRFDIPYLHMKELLGFHRFQDRSELAELSKAIIKTISESGIRAFASITRLRDLARFNKDFSQCLNAYSLNIYICMRLIRLLYHESLGEGSFVEMWLDRIAKPDQKIILAKEYAATNAVMPEVANLVFPMALPKGGMSKLLYPLQAADFIAWECRRDWEHKDDWFESREDGAKGKDYDRFHYPHWVHDNGVTQPFARRSMAAFMHNAKVALGGWTYDSLRGENEFRNGVWTIKKKRRALAERPS